MYNYTGNNYAYVGMNLPISSANINKTGLMLCERVRYTARTGVAVISTANSNLDGSGAVVDLIMSGGNGLLVNRITIKAQGTTTQGMVRFFYYNNSTTLLIYEVEIPAITQSATTQTLIKTIDFPIYLKSSNYKLKVSTEKAETFIITAEGMTMSYPA